jgi:hypothetical protein
VRLPALVLTMSALVGCSVACSAGEAGQSPTPSVVTVSAVPEVTRTPGRQLASACLLLGTAEIASTLGVPSPTATEQNLQGGAVVGCRYQIGDHQHVMLFVATQPATGTARQAADRVIQTYNGTIKQVPGIGDAAVVAGDTKNDVAVAAVRQGGSMRTVTITTALDKITEDPLLSLLRLVMERV